MTRIAAALLFGFLIVACASVKETAHIATDATRTAEAMAAASILRTLNMAQLNFLSTNNGRYAESIDELVKAGVFDSSNNPPGYTFALTKQSEEEYFIRATPVKRDGYHLSIATDRIVRFEIGKPASNASAEFGAH